MDDVPRKYHDKEAFVTGHSGGTIHEILLLCMIIPAGLRFYYALLPYIDLGHTNTDIKMILLEFATLIFPMLLVQTSLMGSIGQAMVLTGMLLLASILSPRSQSNIERKIDSINNERKRPMFLSIHRSSVYLLTTIAILAVDFPLFPRKYCKTETSGYGWMDLGAASFVIIAGWTSSLSSCGSHGSMGQRVVKKCTPLILLGVIRLLTNKGLEYQEHVSEYGVHWNFFFTLCFIEGFMVLWRRIKSEFGDGVSFDGIVATATMITYQTYLSFGGQDFIENAERRCTNDYAEAWTMCDLFYANREGAMGLVGYISLRLLSEEIGRLCIIAPPRQKRLILVTSAIWIGHFVLTSWLQILTSRRSTNLPFIMWALAHNMTILSLIDYVSTTFSSACINGIPRTLDSVNRNGLAVFLISNILTGLVNLTVDTLHSSHGKAMGVLTIYLGVVCGSALLLDNLLRNRKDVD